MENTKKSDELKHWHLFAAKNADGVIIVRLRVEKPTLHDIHLYQSSVVVKWEYESEDQSGMPSDVEKELMDEFEVATDELTRYNGNSYLVVVATGLGVREWIYYGKDYEAFIDKLNACLRGYEKFPIEIEHYDDPEWKNWEDFIQLYRNAEN